MIATTLHQIEITSRCNLSCRCCLHPILTRPKADMPGPTWLAAMRWLQHFVAAGTQGELVLTGTGEPTLHPDLVAYATEARRVCGPNRRIMITTNGVSLTQAQVDGLRAVNVRCYVSAHNEAAAVKAAIMLQQAGLLEQVVMDPIIGPNDWAGQVDWPDITRLTASRRPLCPWLTAGWMFVASDGTIYDCCYANGDAPARGHVDQAVHAIMTSTRALCEKCWQRPPQFNEAPEAILR